MIALTSRRLRARRRVENERVHRHTLRRGRKRLGGIALLSVDPSRRSVAGGANGYRAAVPGSGAARGLEQARRGTQGDSGRHAIDAPPRRRAALTGSRRTPRGARTRSRCSPILLVGHVRPERSLLAPRSAWRLHVRARHAAYSTTCASVRQARRPRPAHSCARAAYQARVLEAGEFAHGRASDGRPTRGA